MELVQLDVAIRIGAISTILMVAWLLLCAPQRANLPAVLFAPLATCLSSFVVGNTAVSSLHPAGIVGDIAQILSGYTVVFLWWFCLSCFDSRFKLRGGVLAVGLAWIVVAGMDRGLFGKTSADLRWSRLLVIMGFGIVAHLMWRLIAERSGDLILQRHEARIMVAVLLGGMLIIDLSADAIFGFAWRPAPFAMAQNVMILVFGLWFARKTLVSRPEILSWSVAVSDTPVIETRPNLGDERQDELRRRLIALMEKERLFLDSELTFAAFVERMGAPDRAVRALVNHELGYDHFRTFLNHYRMAEARRLLGDSASANVKLIAIALDSGFASLASFNRVFRAVEGCSPSQYRAAALNRDAYAKGSAPKSAFDERKAVF